MLKRQCTPTRDSFYFIIKVLSAQISNVVQMFESLFYTVTVVNTKFLQIHSLAFIKCHEEKRKFLNFLKTNKGQKLILQCTH